MKNKHLTIEQRRMIERELNDATSFKRISSIIGKDPSTVSKEARKYSVSKRSGCYGKKFNNCLHRYSCKEYFVCGDECNFKKPKLCAICTSCLIYCSNFIEEICPHLSNPPYVCHGCHLLTSCTLSKRVYDAIFANQFYRLMISAGFSISEDEFAFLDNLISPLIKNQEQSIHGGEDVM